ncbi:MAG: hypothetical protein GXX79_07960 [Actinomycetales bacterium]|nr:hypothetical protein [Actinomycetales bacterium]
MHGPRMLHEEDGRLFEMLRARESAPECASVELWDVAPAPGRGLLAAAAHCTGNGTPTFQSFTRDEIPLSAMEWFMANARKWLRPERPHPSG